MASLGTVTFGFLSGVVGWVLMEFVAKPVRSFFDLRRETDRQITLTAIDDFSYEINEHGEPVDPKKAADNAARHAAFKAKIADLGAQFLAFANTETAACKLVTFFGFRCEDAAHEILQYADLLNTWGSEPQDARVRIGKALKFS